MEWMTNIIKWTGMRYVHPVRLAQDREPRMIMTANLQTAPDDDDIYIYTDGCSS